MDVARFVQQLPEGGALPKMHFSAAADPVILARLQELVNSVAKPPRIRRATKPTRASKVRRLEGKSQRSGIKANRGKPGLQD